MSFVCSPSQPPRKPELSHGRRGQEPGEAKKNQKATMKNSTTIGYARVSFRQRGNVDLFTESVVEHPK